MARSLLRSRVVVGFVAAALIASLTHLGYAQPFPGLREFLGAAIEVQERHTDRLLALPGVVGTAVGLRADGQPVIKAYTTAPGITGIPTSLEGIPVEVKVTGEFVALDRGSSPAAGGLSTTSSWPRPVPIGVSTGNAGQCSAGTIGARVKDATNVYALSNNHVYALENVAPLGSNVLQPGLFDTACTFSGNNIIGTLAAFVPIVFDSTASNTIDAAIALSSITNLGNSTPADGYGTPKSATVSAFVGQAVQKYGRTSNLTQGAVAGVNATVLVGYSSGTARFVDQIIVQSNKPFIKPGDSGSLLVTILNANPVGLLFAGTSSGKFAVANRIDLVLASFGVAVDGAP